MKPMSTSESQGIHAMKEIKVRDSTPAKTKVLSYWYNVLARKHLTGFCCRNNSCLDNLKSLFHYATWSALCSYLQGVAWKKNARWCYETIGFYTFKIVWQSALKVFLETFSNVLLVSLFFNLADGDDINYFVRKVMELLYSNFFDLFFFVCLNEFLNMS